MWQISWCNNTPSPPIGQTKTQSNNSANHRCPRKARFLFGQWLGCSSRDGLNRMPHRAVLRGGERRSRPRGSNGNPDRVAFARGGAHMELPRRRKLSPFGPCGHILTSPRQPTFPSITHSPPPSTLRISAPCPSCRSAGADLGTRSCCTKRSPSEVTMGIGPWLGVPERYRCSGSSVALFGLLLNDGG